jgi:RecA-family ATPase
LISFGTSESMVNDNEQALVTAARVISRGLDCCVRYSHHTGQSNAREKALDQYAGRNGTALPDGTRMTSVMQFWDDESKLTPPPGCEPDPDSSIMVLARPKLSYSAPNLPLIWIKRTGYAFRYYVGEPVGRGNTNDAQKQQQVEQDAADLLIFLASQVEHGALPTPTRVAEGMRPAGISKSRANQAIAHLIKTKQLISKPVPQEKRRGGLKEFLQPVAEDF